MDNEKELHDIKAGEIVLMVLKKYIKETYTRFLISSGETNVPRFAIHALRLARENDKEAYWEEIIESYRNLMEDEIKRDGPSVMNIAGIINALNENKNLIFSLIDKMPGIIEEVNGALERAGYNQLTNEEDFENLMLGWY